MSNLKKYILYKKSCLQSPETIKTDKYILEPYDHLTPEEAVEKFINWSQTVEIITAYNALKRLKTYYRWLYKNKYYNKDYSELFPKIKQPKLKPKCLTRDQSNILLQCSARYSIKAQAIFSMFLFTGMRKSELLNLHQEHVDLRAREIFIHKSKGNKDRLIPINESLYFVLRQWNKRRKKDLSYFSISERTLRRLKDKITLDTGFRFTFHQLRHTFGTYMVQNGVDLISVRDIMGHSSVRTTELYLSSSSEHLKSEIDKLEF
jgi:integrase